MKSNDISAPHGLLAKSAIWWEVNHVSIAHTFGPILFTLVGIWASIWYPDALTKYSKIPEKDRCFTFWFSQYTVWAFIAASVISIYGGIAGFISAKKKDATIKELCNSIAEKSDLANKLEEAQLAVNYLKVKGEDEIYEITSDYLGHIAVDHLQLTDKERLTLYIMIEGKFYLVGRHSLNDVYKTVGRHELDKEEGCIGFVWRDGGDHGRAYCELPDNPEQRAEEQKSKYGMNLGIAKTLRMPSVCYWCVTLNEGFERTGVIVLESTRKGFLEDENLYKMVEKHKVFLLQCLRRSRKAAEADSERSRGEPNEKT